MPYTRDTCHLILDIWYLIFDTWYPILDIWYSIFDTQYLILDIWYSISDTQYLIRYLILNKCYSISATQFCYSILDTSYLILDIRHLDTCSLKLWYMLPVTCQMLIDIWNLQKKAIWFFLHEAKDCYYL